MPLIVDHESVRKKILDAFELCVQERMLFDISLRHVAAKAGMSHQKLLHYFPSKESLVVGYCEYTKQYMVTHCKDWFDSHNPKDYSSTLAYMNDFMRYVSSGESGENRPQATIQTYILAKYNPKIKKIVSDEFISWRQTMEACLKKVYGDSIGAEEAEAMMILITGTFVCNYTEALTGNINSSILSQFEKLR